MLSCKSEVIGCTTLIVVFCLLHIVALCIVALSVGIATFSNLIEYLLEFHTLPFVCREPYETEESTESDVVHALIIDSLSEIVRLVVHLVVGTKHIVLHIVESAEGITVVETSRQSQCLRVPDAPSL